MYDEYDEDDTYFVGRPDRWGSPLRDQTLTMLWPPPPFYIHHNYEGTGEDEEEENDDEDNALAVPLYPS